MGGFRTELFEELLDEDVPDTSLEGSPSEPGIVAIDSLPDVLVPTADLVPTAGNEDERIVESSIDVFSSLIAEDLKSAPILAETRLDSDGQNIGLTAYELVQVFGGSKPIESPDLYEINHPGEPHVYESLDAQIGNHFVFVIHRDEDRDRDKENITDRQRNEIKAYGGSSDDVKGFLGETMTYRWKFKVNASMAVSKNFSHFFQLKAVGGDDSQPILTLTGRELSGEDVIEIRHSPASETNYLGRMPWHEVTGEWLEVYVRASYAEQGSLRLILSRISDNAILFDVTEEDIDLWRGESTNDFVRPKWGIYRSLKDADNLRPEEERVDFANFSVQKMDF